MKIINIADEKSRNTRVGMSHKKRAALVRRVDLNLQPAESVRAIKGTLSTDFTSLTKKVSPADLSQQLIDGDPEIDLEVFGKRVYETVRIYLNSQNEPAGAVTLKEQVYNSRGELTEERPLAECEANINSELPLKWSGRYFTKEDCVKKFVFTNAFQLNHSDGLTFDFLFNMAKVLSEKNSLLFLGAGTKSNEPLTINRNGKQYRAFLEGRIKGNAYMLIMHLTNMELKTLPKEEE